VVPTAVAIERLRLLSEFRTEDLLT
jgi:hypothetical protein